MSNDDLKGLEPEANKTNYVGSGTGSDTEEGTSRTTAYALNTANFDQVVLSMLPTPSARLVF